MPEEKSHVVKQLLEDADLQTTVRQACAKVSIVGAGITGVPGVTAKIVGALSEKISLFYNQRIVILLFGY